MPLNHNTLAGLFSDIANAIRAKTGGSSQITADDFPTAIGAIQTGTPKAAQTYYPTTSDQTIASGYRLTGTQTFKGVVLTNLSADNIKAGVTVTVGDSVSAGRIASITGTYSGGGGGGSSEISYYYGEGGYDVTANISSIPDIVFFHGWSSDFGEEDNHAVVISGWATFNANGTIKHGGCNFLPAVDRSADLNEMDPLGGSPAENLEGGISGGVLTLYPVTPIIFELTEYMIIAVGASVYG